MAASFCSSKRSCYTGKHWVSELYVVQQVGDGKLRFCNCASHGVKSQKREPNAGQSMWKIRFDPTSA